MDGERRPEGRGGWRARAERQNARKRVNGVRGSLSHRIHLLIGFGKSTPLSNRQLIVYYY